MMSPTEYRRRLVLAVAIATAATVLALAATFVRPARAEPSAPICWHEASVASELVRGAMIVDRIVGPRAPALSDAVSDFYGRPRFGLPLMVAFVYPSGMVRLEGFKADGCNYADIRESLAAYDLQRSAIGMPPLFARAPALPNPGLPGGVREPAPRPPPDTI